jgi:MerR family transcriptional regulator, copper efflux regulator
MSEPVPIACALTSADLAAQAHRWKRLIAGDLTDRAEIADGLRLSFRAEAAAELRALVAVEAECCPWAAWRVERADGSVVLDVRSPGEGAAVLHVMFADDRPGRSPGRTSAS